MKTNFNLSLSELAKVINSGQKSDVDYLMSFLTEESAMATIKMIDFAISQISNPKGVEQIKYYLFNGTKIQRSYAVLYFKRHKFDEIVLEAVINKCIDEKQAFSV